MFKVMLRYGRGPQTQSGTTFKTLAEAQAHFNKEIQKAVMMKSNAIYSIYDFDEIVEEKDTSKMDALQLPREPEASGSSSQGNASRFSPSPLSTSLKPKGATSNWKDEDEKDKK